MWFTVLLFVAVILYNDYTPNIKFKYKFIILFLENKNLFCVLRRFLKKNYIKFFR